VGRRLETGLSFVSALTDFRLHRAKALLLSGGYTAAGAAYAAGFGDVAHFYRVFKSREGKTPGEWLRQTEPDA
jgi:AraC-like DNA-binding protein